MPHIKDLTGSFAAISSSSSIGRWRWMKQLNENEYSEAFHLFNIMAETGSNVGIGEYPTLKFLTTILQKSVALGLYDERKTLQDLVIVKPYHVVRHANPIIGHIILASRSNPVEKRTLNKLIKIGCEIAGREDCGGFKGCVVEVFYPCLTHLQCFREEGFVVTCVVPLAGLLTGYVKGHLMNYVLYKDLHNKTPKNSQVLPSELSFRQPKPIQYTSDFKPNLLRSRAALPLEVQSKIKPDLRLTVRHLRPDEFRDCYKGYADAMDQGFGINELPSYEMFLPAKLHNSYCFVIEDSATKDAVSYIILGSSRFTRCQTEKNRLGYVAGVILPKYRGSGIGSDFMQIVICLAASCGYEHLVATAAIMSMPIVRSCQFERNTFVGTIPNAIYFSQYGWIDLAVHDIFTGQHQPIRSFL